MVRIYVTNSNSSDRNDASNRVSHNMPSMCSQEATKSQKLSKNHQNAPRLLSKGKETRLVMLLAHVVVCSRLAVGHGRNADSFSFDESAATNAQK